MPATVCLNMIARQDDETILASLQSVVEHIDHWVIADLDCSAQRVAEINEVLGSVPGEFVEIDHQSFAASKNALFEYSAQFADYLLFIDPDMVVDIGFADYRSSLTHAGYFLQADQPVQYSEIRLVKASEPWAWRGVVNEILLCKEAVETPILADVTFVRRYSPSAAMREARSKRQSLWDHLQEYQGDGHSLFHYARLSMQDGDWDAALEFYDRFLAADDDWDPEWRWYALYHRGKVLEKLASMKADDESPDAEFSQAREAYLQAWGNRPWRAEPLYELSRMHRTNGEMLQAHLYSQQAMTLQLPERESYDLERAVYQWHIPAEHAANSEVLGLYDQAIRATNKALRSDHVAIKRNTRHSLMFSRQRCVEALMPQVNFDLPAERNERIRLVVPFRNAGEHLRKSIETIRAQDYPDFTATFIDDASDDGSGSLVPLDDPRFELITNTERVGPLVNRLNFILSCDPDDIVFYLDGDDQLAGTSVLGMVNQIYQQTGCWLSYGQNVSQTGEIGNAIPYVAPSDLIDDLESGMQRFPIHPISHRAGLLQRLEEFDPQFSCFKDDDGEWLFWASDAVLARPLFYMAGQRHSYYCHRVLYLYTAGHEISESIHNKQDQLETCRMISNRLRPPPLDGYRRSQPGSDDS